MTDDIKENYKGFTITFDVYQVKGTIRYSAYAEIFRPARAFKVGVCLQQDCLDKQKARENILKQAKEWIDNHLDCTEL